MSIQDQLRGVPIFSELSKKELSGLSNLMTQIDVKAGRTLTKQGSRGREFFIITEGTSRVDIDGEVVAHLSAGDIIGELSVITDSPRTATVTTTSEGTLQVLNRREFMAMLDENPLAARKILVAAVKRLQENQQTKTS